MGKSGGRQTYLWACPDHQTQGRPLTTGPFEVNHRHHPLAHLHSVANQSALHLLNHQYLFHLNDQFNICVGATASDAWAGLTSTKMMDE